MNFFLLTIHTLRSARSGISPTLHKYFDEVSYSSASPVSSYSPLDPFLLLVDCFLVLSGLAVVCLFCGFDSHTALLANLLRLSLSILFFISCHPVRLISRSRSTSLVISILYHLQRALYTSHPRFSLSISTAHLYTCFSFSSFIYIDTVTSRTTPRLSRIFYSFLVSPSLLTSLP